MIVVKLILSILIVERLLKKNISLNEIVIISGKVSFFKNKYQMTNPDYVTGIQNQNYVVKNIPKKYSLTKGLNEKYRTISEQITNNLPEIDDWLSKDFLKVNNLIGWNDCINRLHNSKESKNNNSQSYRRLVFDEILANLLALSENRKRIKRKKIKKRF